MSTTPNMLLLLPIPTITAGPTYASEEVTAFTTIDSHDHTPNKGVPVPTLGLNINNDLTFNGYNATTLRSTIFSSQSAVLTEPTDINSLYVVNGNLFYNNNSGQPVQITSGAAIDATTVGGFGGDYATSTALAFYTSADRTFTFWSNTNVPTNLDAGSITIRPIATSPDGITISAPSGLATNYTFTLPATLPGSTSVITSDSSGNLGYSSGGLTVSGVVQMYVGVTPPTGFLLCDGTSYLIATYPALAAALFDAGTGLYAYGSADGTHFNVPDFRGIFPRGTNLGASNDPDASSRTAANTNGNTGNNVGSTQSYQIQSHTHTETVFSGVGGATTGVTRQDNVLSSAFENSIFQTAATGGNETRPINTYINFIIKT